MTGSSFDFGHYNSVDDWGIRVNAHDFLFPPKRARKITIPHRDGAYDFGAENYDERTLRIECTLERKISRAALRKIVYILCQKKQIRLWNEPEKYYVGELYDPGVAGRAKRYFSLSRKNAQNRCGCKRNAHFD